VNLKVLLGKLICILKRQHEWKLFVIPNDDCPPILIQGCIRCHKIYPGTEENRILSKLIWEASEE